MKLIIKGPRPPTNLLQMTYPSAGTSFYNEGVTGLGPISIIQGDVFLVIVL